MRTWLDGIPLRTRLVGIVTALLVLALVLIAAASLAVLRPVLVNQVDARLAPAVRDRQLVGDLLATRDGVGNPALPSDYVVQLTGADGERLITRAGPMIAGGEVPDLRGIGVQRVKAEGGRPYTVDGWRVVSVEVPSIRTPSYDGPGTLSLALPLGGVEETLEQLRQRIVLLGLVVVAACAVLGGLAVQRSLRPLREVEDVADAFGAGDTSRRVRPLPVSTEVGRLGYAVNGMLANIETSLAAREASENRMRRFVADASHELRTPLAAVRGFAELYRQGAVSEPDDLARTMRRVEDEAARMGGLVDDLLLLARLDEQRPMRRDDVDLLVIAADAVQDAHALAPERQVRLTGLEPAWPPSPAPVIGDDARLRQVLANLVGNVVRHTPAGTPLEIGVGVRDGWAVWRVADHGPGIPAADAERVFERFYRTDASRHRTAGGGSGLGLAIVAAVVGGHGGAVRVVGTPGGGTTVEVAVPAGSTPSPDDDADGGR